MSLTSEELMEDVKKVIKSFSESDRRIIFDLLVKLEESCVDSLPFYYVDTVDCQTTPYLRLTPTEHLQVIEFDKVAMLKLYTLPPSDKNYKKGARHAIKPFMAFWYSAWIARTQIICK